MKIGIVIPWREQPSRIEPFKKVKFWYMSNFPDAKMYLVDSGHKTWNMSATRNLGVQLAEEDGCDIVILSDADTLPELAAVQSAVSKAHQDDYIHNPYNEYRLLSHEMTEKFLKNQDKSIYDYPFHLVEYSCAGVWIFKPSSWWAIGGSDEGFEGWGWEDTAFEIAHKVVHGIPFKKHAGIVVAMEHEWQSEKQVFDTPNHKRFLQYKELKNKEELFNLIK